MTLQAATMEEEEPSTPTNALLDLQDLYLSSPDSPKESTPLATWEALEIDLASFKKKFEAGVAASKKDKEALEIELAKSKKETAFKDGQLEYMMDLYMKQSVGEKQYSTIGEETDSVSEEIDLLEFLGVSNDVELGVLDDGELADSLTDSDE
ncbi:PREDICTED: uncharacterized protein LOC103342767 isoform X2 [Prunus mume]|uniref:Uncharacterized protein LOC103342767 isoform X2 n=1 Tax=Prunus mume TaxID=102107 RepID=A0ABM0PUG3_PRUMU|nr:PREDICTED: uncharacterized protein LOC103342767 isoform X2 [Prunus mume]